MSWEQELKALRRILGGGTLAIVGGAVPGGFGACGLDPSCESPLSTGWAITLLVLAGVLTVVGLTVMVRGMLAAAE